MATTEYKNHLVEIVIESNIPMSLFEDSQGQELVEKLLRLKTVSGVRELRAERIDENVVFTVQHNGGTYTDAVAVGDEDAPVTWPQAVNDPYPLREYVFLMETRLSLRQIFQSFQPTLVEVVFF